METLSHSFQHYERSIECFNSTLNKSERIFNLDPRKAEVCIAEASFENNRWTFTAGPTTIWVSPTKLSEK